MASYLPIVLLICLQITGGLCQCGPGNNAICGWQIAVIVLLSIALVIVLLSSVGMICCGLKKGSKQSQCGGGDVYLQNLGCRSQQ